MAFMKLTFTYDDLIDIFDSRFESTKEIEVDSIKFNKKKQQLIFNCINM